MKLITILLLSLFTSTTGLWLTNINEAKKEAAEKHEMILLNFSGSDWCSPCIQMKNKIFESDEFKDYSSKCLVLVNADFPRLKKNKLSKDQIQQNDALADKYNKEGKFPLTILINSEGKVIKEWDGLPDATPVQFVQQIKAATDAQK